jgi:two-component system, LytTR family, response regulator
VDTRDRAAGLHALVVDDEPIARRNLIVLLGRDPDVGKVSECGSGQEAVVQIRSTRPDIVFLDVQMPECDGFDALEMLGGDQPPAIVFVTAYDEFALRAFDAGALDYLQKPFDDARFERALTRAKDRVAQSRGRVSTAARRLMVKSAGRVVFVGIPEIDWIEAADYYACLHVGSQSHLVRRSLDDLDGELGVSGFCRIHRSAVVNLERVRALEIRKDGEYEVVLTSEVRLRLSRRYRRKLQERLARGAGA